MERTCICQGHLCPQKCSPSSRVPREASCVKADGGAAGRGEGQGATGARHQEEWGGTAQSQPLKGHKTEEEGRKRKPVGAGG